MTSSASPSKTTACGVISLNGTVFAIARRPRPASRRCLSTSSIPPAIEERLLRQMVDLAVEDFLERRDRVCELDVLARTARELLGHEERLREEALHAARAADGDLVVFGELFDAENRDDVLQVFDSAAASLARRARRGSVRRRRSADRGCARSTPADRRPDRCPAPRSAARARSSHRDARTSSRRPDRCSRRPERTRLAPR